VPDDIGQGNPTSVDGVAIPVDQRPPLPNIRQPEADIVSDGNQLHPTGAVALETEPLSTVVARPSAPAPAAVAAATTLTIQQIPPQPTETYSRLGNPVHRSVSLSFNGENAENLLGVQNNANQPPLAGAQLVPEVPSAAGAATELAAGEVPMPNGPRAAAGRKRRQAFILFFYFKAYKFILTLEVIEKDL